MTDNPEPLRIKDPVEDIPDSFDPQPIENPSDLPIELGTSVAVSVTEDSYRGGIVVGVNEHDRPIVMTIDVDVNVGVGPHLRTTGWDALQRL